MKKLQLGIVLTDFRSASTARDPDPVDLLILRSTFLNPPRVKAAESISRKLRKTHIHAELIPYVWHLVSHRVSDHMSSRATRSLSGEPQKFGHLQATDEVRHAWNITLQYTKAMQASRLILRTPPSFTPSQENQNRLRDFSQQCAEQNIQLWWEVEGLWQQDLLVELSQQLHIWLISSAFDRTGRVMEEHLSSQCLIVDSHGAIPRLRDVMTENLLHSLEASKTANVECVLFAGRFAYANLQTFVAHRESLFI